MYLSYLLTKALETVCFSPLLGVMTVFAMVRVSVCAAEKVSSLGKNWHRPCLRCERCNKTLAAGSHAEVRYESVCKAGNQSISKNVSVFD